MKVLTILTMLLLMMTGVAQVPSPLAQQKEKVLLINARAHTGTGKVIDKAAVGVVAGKIELITNALTYQLKKEEWDTIIDLTGQEMYPGFIATNSTIGLTEIDAVRATRDFKEVGVMNPNVRSLIAYNTDSKITYTIRTNGVLSCQSVPRGGLISGTSSVFALDGWNWEDAVYLKDDGIHINWPKQYHQTGWWAEPGEIKPNKSYQKTVKMLVDFFEAAEAYHQSKHPIPTDLKKAAMYGVFKGRQRVYFHADFAPEINDVIDFAHQFNLKFPVVVGGYDAGFLADRLKENKFSVMLSKPHALPKFEGDHPAINYRLPAILQAKGLLFCIQNAGDMEVMNARNLPFLAGTARTYGLTTEEAVAAISTNAAKILGIDHRIGSLEKGKQATLFVSNGDALDMRTNAVSLAMVDGRFIALTNHQMALSEKYHKRYGLK